MKDFLKFYAIFMLWAVEISADTFEVLTIPYEQLFPKGYQENGGRHRYHMPRYPQNYPKYPQPQPPSSKADWVCRNPSTGDMLIISADSLQFGNNGRNPQVPNVRPDYPERTPTPQTTVTQNPNNPFLPNTPSSQGPLNCNAYPKHPMCGEVLIETTTFKIPETTPNYNGEGKIDIRMKQAEEEDDRPIFSD